MEATPNTGYWQIPAAPAPTPEPITPTLAPPPPPALAPTKRKGLWIAAGVAAVIVPIAAVLIGIGIGSNSTTDAATGNASSGPVIPCGANACSTSTPGKTVASVKPLNCGAGSRPNTAHTHCEMIPATTVPDDSAIVGIDLVWSDARDAVCKVINESTLDYQTTIRLAVNAFFESMDEQGYDYITRTPAHENYLRSLYEKC